MESGYGDRGDGQEEWFYVVRTEAFDPRGTLGDEELRAESLHELRWRDVAAIRALADETAARPVLTAPRALADLVETLLLRATRPGVVQELDV